MRGRRAQEMTTEQDVKILTDEATNGTMIFARGD